MRFGMARALVKRAGEVQSESLGADEGDPYLEALHSRSIPVEMEIAVKEILDHLRSALDYCARQVWETCGTGSNSARIYFPIVSRNFDKKDFRSRVGKLMPGVLQSRPDLLQILESFQPFASADNQWLADLATLSNQTKHVHLSIVEVSAASMKTWLDEGKFSLKRPDGRPLRYFPVVWTSGENHKFNADYEGPAYYIGLEPIDAELLGFLDESRHGVAKVIDILEAALAGSTTAGSKDKS